MNLGTWIVSAAGGTTGLAALLSTSPGRRGRLGDVAGLAAGVAGLPLSGYTGVLLANTAVPIWQGARNTLPWLFVASATASAASILGLLPQRGRAAQVVHRFGLAGRVGEVVAMEAMRRELESRGPGPLMQPLERGPSGLLWRAAKGLGLVGLALSLLPRAPRAVRVAAGVLGAASALAVRFAVAEAGNASARDPRATFEPQRARRPWRADDGETAPNSEGQTTPG
jgi:formate-dependent nitrite reductase membrane component NrfD